ncbi:MAG TPA: iron-containing redox enzyme family protein [Polyangiales bacterium]|nr:iron-containing redox enzyme family protein [Polyangiales bacterium]
MALDFHSVYLTSSGSFLPGEPVDNEALDRFIAPLDGGSERVKRVILAENGILTRHYAIDEQGETRCSTTRMAALAVEDCLRRSGVALNEVGLLCTGSAGGDLQMPGFANMLQGELGAGPMHTSSHQGVCAAGMVALQHAASALALGEHEHALVVASEFPSRMFKRSRFAPRDYQASYDTNFLRYMLSDGAGAWLLSKRPRSAGLSLKLDFVHTRSFSGDHPVCMRISGGAKSRHASFMDYASLAEAERDGAFLLRQDIRLIPRLFELGIHEYVELVRAGRVVPDTIDHFLCHYSSKKFEPVVEELMQKAGLSIAKERWFSNLSVRGNTGAASIFIMLADALRQRELRPGQRILCFVPESGRFTVSFAQFTVVDATHKTEAPRPSPDSNEVALQIAPPHALRAEHDLTPTALLLRELASIWHGYQTRLFRTPTLRKITTGTFARADYLAWMESWIPQVRFGSHWMRRAADSLEGPFASLTPLIREHARDESEDYGILFDDYKSIGGAAESIDDLRRNPGGEALNAFMFRLAEQPNPVGLLGGIYIIEGTGQRVIPALLPNLRRLLPLPERAFRFLQYHGENDQHHLARWLSAAEQVLAHDDEQGSLRARIVETARDVSELYLLQFRYLT